MSSARNWKILFMAGVIATPVLVTGCTTSKGKGGIADLAAGVTDKSVSTKTYAYTPKDRECLKRAMFFEANRSSKDGLMAVGTVVMNRLASGKYPGTICGVVGQKNQFAPGVLTRKMNSSALPDVEAAADAVLKGQRHPKLKNAMFFHTAGLKFPYRNMHYVLVAGGNAFYEKRRRDGSLETPVPAAPTLIAQADLMRAPAMPDMSTVTASSQTVPLPMPSPKDQPVDQVQVASLTTDQGFGPRAKGDRVASRPAAMQPQMVSYQPTPSQAEAHTTTVSGETALGDGAEQKSVDAIGALLLSQDRPEPGFQ
ncbi:cell wall hydrolase [Phyllobacterium salinisoli]|uniref:Cell wall hydrolase n=1 Tax=Phyllobacterium salinisoli TaxID=1899321 RepID=A0A368KAE8_9HYPH|nr:cell wall hydrolase [Phyllobacterium salinisoli]RCS25060.1 cell wall hydrolase [Phyllobacterium salinisoli]